MRIFLFGVCLKPHLLFFFFFNILRLFSLWLSSELWTIHSCPQHLTHEVGLAFLWFLWGGLWSFIHKPEKSLFHQHMLWRSFMHDEGWDSQGVFPPAQDFSSCPSCSTYYLSQQVKVPAFHQNRKEPDLDQHPPAKREKNNKCPTKYK